MNLPSTFAIPDRARQRPGLGPALRRLGLALCLGMLAPGAVPIAVAADAAVARGRLVDPAWLQAAMHDAASAARLVILDASPAPLHAAQHIPGARHVDVFADGPRLAGPAEMERRFQSWGLGPGAKVVVYDQGGSYFAPRLFYDLVLHGVPESDVHLLDGGLARWRAAGGALTKDPTPAPARGTLRVAQLREELRTQLPEFLTASGDPRGHALLEALEPGMYYGESAWFDRAGHVPNALMTPTGDYFNADKTFKSPDELRRMMAHLGVQPAQQLHSYCGGGFAAAVPFFALRYVAGFPKVKLFPGSQLEWLRDDRGLPMWTYAAPNLMRETNWLRGWNSKMLRSVGAAPVSVIDVRPAEAYRAGHLPFAVNLPAEVFRRHLREPEKLAALLGRAGVNAAHEAVIVSDNGLDADAGIAYWMLERLGQRRVSVFIDSLVRWAELGQEVVREPAAAAEAARPGDVARTSAYQAKPRQEGLLAEANAPEGADPRVVIALGAKPPAAVPAADLRRLHLPLATLLQPDGRPKAAKDLWKLMTQAGVPRYTELWLAADDPGEAAAGHFLFRLMGFANVKVLMR